MAKTDFMIGTSGWQYKDWRGKFYPQDIPLKSWFDYYARQFDSVEVNSTFYHMPKTTAIENWRDSSPDKFRFVIKLNRYLTHTKRLKPDEAFDDWLGDFVRLIAPLGSKLAAVIAQLPPGLKADMERLEHFFESVRQLESDHGMKFPLAMEYRHASWFTEDVYRLMRRYGCANVINSSPDRWPSSRAVTADFAYLRFHGSRKLYGSSYNDDELRKWADFIRRDCAGCRQVMCFFNNDQHAYAPENARRLARLLKDM